MENDITKLEEDTYTYHFFFNHGIYDELKHYEELINETDLFLKTKVIEMKGIVDEEVTCERFGKKIQYESIFPLILWKSIFLSSYFFLENSLDQISKNLKKSNLYTISLKDMQGNGISRSSLYLKKVCGINAPFESQIWVAITDLNKIRNVFVHSDGVISKSTSDTIKVCEKYSQIRLANYEDDNLALNIDHEFCKFALSKIEELLRLVHSDMQREESKQ
jgi:hypothetical protein